MRALVGAWPRRWGVRLRPSCCYFRLPLLAMAMMRMPRIGLVLLGSSVGLGALLGLVVAHLAHLLVYQRALAAHEAPRARERCFPLSNAPGVVATIFATTAG